MGRIILRYTIFEKGLADAGPFFYFVAETVFMPITKNPFAIRRGSDTPVLHKDALFQTPDLLPIFTELKNLLAAYQKGSMKLRGGYNGQVALVTEQAEEHYFSGVLVQKHFVGFYLMPVYLDAGLKQQLSPGLLACLKGKSCFHIHRNDPALYPQINDALEAGFQLYQQRGWV